MRNDWIEMVNFKPRQYTRKMFFLSETQVPPKKTSAGALLKLLITWCMSYVICKETAFIFYLFLFYFFVEQGDGRGIFALCYKLQWHYLGITTKSMQNLQL